MAHKNIDEHIVVNKTIIEDPLVSSQSRRHLQQELDSLEKYKENHPEDKHDPSSLELFCDSNPDAIECKIFDV